MQEYFIEISKYLTAALLIMYTIASFTAFLGTPVLKKVMHVIQSVLVFAVQIVMFAHMAFVSKGMEYFFMYAFVQVLLLAMLILVPLIYERADRLLLNHMCMLTGIGLGMLSRLNFKKAERQYVIALISLIIALFIPWLLERIRIWKRFTWLYGLTGIVLLSAVLIWGSVTHGSKISFTVMIPVINQAFSFQPSEFVKIIYLFFLAGALRDKPKLSRIMLSAAFAGLYVIILVFARDLGGALIFFVGYVFLVFGATKNYLYLLAGAVGGSGAAYVAYMLFDHVKSRVLAWQDPWAYIDTKGYAITQSLFAIGSGSWFGMGLLEGNPSSIPYVEEDFVFSAICEEMGIICGCCLLLIMICCFLNIMKIAIRVRDSFYQLIAYGIGVIYIFQIFLTVGGGIKLIPLTGVTLPFISYGGSSVMATIFMFFIVQGIAVRLQKEQSEDLQQSAQSIQEEEDRLFQEERYRDESQRREGGRIDDRRISSERGTREQDRRPWGAQERCTRTRDAREQGAERRQPRS